MPVFEWTAKDASGRLRSGKIKAKDLTDASKKVQARGLTDVSVREASSKKGGLFKRVSTRDLAIFSRQFAVMIEAGIPIVQALEILAEQTQNGYFSSVISEVREMVETGKTLAESMEKYPKAFPTLLTQMVAVGETGGALAETLKEVASYYEKMDSLKRKIKSAMMYPMIVLVITVLIVGGLLIFVVPQFASIYADMGAELPGPTLIVIKLSNMLIHNIIWVILGTIIFIVLFRRFLSSKKGRAIWDSFILRVIIFGPLVQKSSIARFARTLSILLTSGVPILQSLEITAKASGNYVISEAVMKARERIGEGKTIGGPLRETGIFPPLVVHLVTVGEQTGRLSEMLDRIATFYEEEVDAAVEGLSSIIEPLMLVFIGAIVGGILIALYLPIFKLGATIK